MDNQNITFRPKQRNLGANSPDETEHDTSLLDCTMRSLPAMTDCGYDCQEKLTNLEIKLSSAEEEIENLNSQNSELKNQLEKSSRVIALYKKIGITENSMSSISTPVIHRIKKVLSNRCLSPPPKKICLTINQSTQTLAETTCVPNNMHKPVISKKYKQRLRKQRKKISNLIIRINKLKIQNQNIREELENLYKANTDEYEEIVATSDSENSVTFVTEKEQLTHDTVLQEHITQHVTEVANSPTDIPNNNIKLLNTQSRRHKVVILADESGKGVRQVLQQLLGSKYDVFCFWKPGGQLTHVLNSCISEIPSLSTTDYVVLLGFSNDDGLSYTRRHLLSWIEKTQNTNVIICECLHNKYIKEKQLNYELCKLTQQFTNTTFLDMNFHMYKPRPIHFPVYASRYILREIIRLHYISQRKMYHINMPIETNCKPTPCNTIDVTTNTKLCCNTLIDKGIQTDISTGIKQHDIHENYNDFFRI